ncbi:hypothetical protein [Comamonas sp.]|uniref:hypothetical protein n=1 Tax=Comamonas sp. TaxID=34028 RepID=UPI00289B48C1|nr:hypothetical protein [Comamonas sp.]
MLSPAVWVRIFRFAEPVFPFDYSTLISMPLAFLVIVIVSLIVRSPRAALDKAGFPAQEVRAETAVGIDISLDDPRRHQAITKQTASER